MYMYTLCTVYVYVYVHACAYVCVCIYVCVCVCIYIYIYIHIYLLCPINVNVLSPRLLRLFFAAPGIPRNLRIHNMSSKSLRVTWDPPGDPNGIIKEYELTWRLVEEDKHNKVISSDNSTLIRNRLNHIIANLCE